MGAPKGPKKETVDLAKKAATFAGAKGKSLSEIATKFKVSRGIARRAVDLAREQGTLKLHGDSPRAQVYVAAK